MHSFARAAGALALASSVRALANPNTAAATVTACPTLAAIPAVTSAAALFPAPLTVASIVSGDSQARSIYNSILNNATYASALAVSPNPVNTTTLVPILTAPSGDPNCWWEATQCVTPKQSYLQPDIRTCPQGRTYGIGIDDGPLPGHCALYQLLADNNLQGSLFHIGSYVYQNPTAAQQGYNAGHAICVHTWSHKYTTTLTNEQVFAELYYTKLIIKKVVGVTPTCWRPPYGDVDDRVRTIAKGLELDTYLWSADSQDFSINAGLAPSVVLNNFRTIASGANDNSGSMVLQHEITLNVTDAFINSFSLLASAFTNFLSVQSCTNRQAYAEPNAPQVPSFSAYVAGSRMSPGTASLNTAASIYISGGSSATAAATTAATTSATSSAVAGGVTSAGGAATMAIMTSAGSGAATTSRTGAASRPAVAGSVGALALVACAVALA